MEDFQKWCDMAVEQVRFKPDRAAIRKELSDHYMDHYQDLRRLEFPQELAMSRALKAMGDAEEVGRGLNRAHKPWLGWLWLVSRYLAAVILMITVIVAYQDGWWNITHDVHRAPEGDYEADGYFYATEEEQDDYERLLWKKIPGSIEAGSYTLEVPYMAVWQNKMTDGTPIYWLSMVITASDDRFWDDGPRMRYLEMETSNGTLYKGEFETGNSEQTRYYHCGTSQNPFQSTSYIGLCLTDEQGEWIELRNRYGEPWNIRVEWGEIEK